MVDVADKWACEKLDLEVLKVLAKHPEVPAVLVLNKVSVSYDAFMMKVHYSLDPCLPYSPITYFQRHLITITGFLLWKIVSCIAIVFCNFITK